MTQNWLIFSGKGGTGKSTFASALGIALSQRNKEVCCMDTDQGLRCLDILYNLESQIVFDVNDVISKECKLKLALLPHPFFDHLYLLPATQLVEHDWIKKDDLEKILNKLKKRMLYTFVDGPAGLGKNVKTVASAVEDSILVCTADDVSIRDAERAVAMVEAQGKPRPKLVVNRVVPSLVAKGLMYSPQTVSELLDLPLLGFIPEDSEITAANGRHESFMMVDCPAEEAVERIAGRFLGEDIPIPIIKQRRHFLHLRKKRRIYLEE